MNRARKPTSTQLSASSKSKTGPVRGTLSQSGMIRRFSSNSDLSKCSDSSTEDVYLSCEEDGPSSGRSSRRNSNISTSQSPASTRRSKSAGPRNSVSQKDLAKTSPASLGGISSNLQAKSSKNSLSKSLNFGSGELKPKANDSNGNGNGNRKAIAQNKLLPDKPKLFQRSLSTTAASENTGTKNKEHRPIICGKDRPRLTASASVCAPVSQSTSFEELPEPEADANLFEHMEILFEEYRMLELGLYKKLEQKAAQENTTDIGKGSESKVSQRSQNSDKTQQQRGRKPNRDNLQAPSTNSRRASPSPSQRRTPSPSQRKETKPTSKAQATQASKDTKSQTKVVSNRGRKSPSPNRSSARNPETSQSSASTSLAITPSNQQRSDSTSPHKSEKSSIPSPRSRPSSAQQLTRDRTPSPSRCSSKVTSKSNQTSSASSKCSSPAGSSRSLSIPDPKNSGRSSPSPRTEPKSHVHPSNVFLGLRSKEDLVQSAQNDDVEYGDTRASRNIDYGTAAALKVKSHSGSNLRRSSECSDSTKQESDNGESTSESNFIVTFDVPSSRSTSGRTSPVTKSRSPTPSTVLQNNFVDVNAASDVTHQEPNQAQCNDSKIARPSSSPRTSRPVTPTRNGRPATPTRKERPATPTLRVTKTESTAEMDYNVTVPVSDSNANVSASSRSRMSRNLNDSSAVQNEKHTNSGATANKSSVSSNSHSRGRIPDRIQSKVNTNITPRSASLQRSTTFTGSNRSLSGASTAHKTTRPLSAKSRSSISVNTVSDDTTDTQKNQVTSRCLSGSQPELQSSIQAQHKPKLTRMDAVHVQTQFRSQDNITEGLTTVQQNRRCYSSHNVYKNGSPRTPHSKPQEPKEAFVVKQTQTEREKIDNFLENKDPLMTISTDDQIIVQSTPRRDDRGGRTGIPLPVGTNTNMHNPHELKRYDSGVEINSMSPTDSTVNPDEQWQDHNTFDFQSLNNLNDSDDEYY